MFLAVLNTMQALILCVIVATAAASLPFNRLDDLAAAVRYEANLGAEIRPFNLTARDGTKVCRNRLPSKQFPTAILIGDTMHGLNQLVSNPICPLAGLGLT